MRSLELHPSFSRVNADGMRDSSHCASSSLSVPSFVRSLRVISSPSICSLRYLASRTQQPKHERKDSTVKITSTRLKPDEAAAALRDDVEETRVGSISLQIIGPVESSAQRQETPPLETQGVAAPHSQPPPTSGGVDPAGGHDDPNKAVTRAIGLQSSSGSSSSSALTSTVVSRRSSNPAQDQASGLEEAKRGIHRSGFGPGLKRRAFKPFTSSLGPRARDDLMKRPDARELSSTEGNKGVNELNEDDSFRPNKFVGSMRGTARMGLVGGRVGGAGGARHFHAPRSTVVTAATQNAKVRGLSPRVGSGGRPTAVEVADIKECELSPDDVATAASVSNAVENRDDLVLEWTAGDPPQPIKAGGSLTRKLHPHQRDGLKVLWRCLTGRGGLVPVTHKLLWRKL